MINGVLAERTVKDVVPALKTNLEGLEKVLTELTEQYNTKTTEMEKWKVSLVLVYLASLMSPVNLTRDVEEEQCPGGAVGLGGRALHAGRRARRSDRVSGASKTWDTRSELNLCLLHVRNDVIMTGDVCLPPTVTVHRSRYRPSMGVLPYVQETLVL